MANDEYKVKVFPTFTDEDREKIGPPKEPLVFSTERHEYMTPFNYTNVTIGNFTEFEPKGMELAADTGFITIEEEKPIVAVTVVGSGCGPGGYVICEYWRDGERIEDLGPVPRRQRVNNLDGIHFDLGRRVLMGHYERGAREKDYMERHGSVLDWFSHRSRGFYGSLWMGVYENTAYFRVERTHKVTIRGGSMEFEDPHMPGERYPGEYAVRIVETTVVAGPGR